MSVSTLTPEQVKAFESLKRAYKKCKKANVNFYICLDSMYALNGNHLSAASITPEMTDNSLIDHVNLSYMISDYGFSGFADDQHYIEDEVVDRINNDS